MQYWIFDSEDDELELTDLPEITRCAATGAPLGHAVTWHWAQIDGHDVRYACNSDARYSQTDIVERIRAHAMEHGYIKPAPKSKLPDDFTPSEVLWSFIEGEDE